jgi:hypothetical protein
MGMIELTHYDLKNGWELTKPGWYEVHIYEPDPIKSIKKHSEILDWIQTNIGKYEYHCRWYYAVNDLHYKFRYERDFIWFRLLWS